MGILQKALKFFCRFKHPISFPEDIGKDLGIQILYKGINFQNCIEYLIDPRYKPKNLIKFMPRAEAESKLRLAIRKERFKNSSLFSYHVFHGWLAFKLVFDNQNRLRRLYLQHKDLKTLTDEGIEIKLSR